jgi:hypothetical protein
MTAQLIRVSSRATGTREVVRVYIYDELEDLQLAAARFHGETEAGQWGDTLGVCQTYTVQGMVDGEWVTKRQPIVVRLWRGRLDTRIVTHEMSHAACEVYGRTLDSEALASDHLDNANEPLAHLHSDLTAQLVDRLYALGYYGDAS